MWAPHLRCVVCVTVPLCVFDSVCVQSETKVAGKSETPTKDLAKNLDKPLGQSPHIKIVTTTTSKDCTKFHQEQAVVAKPSFNLSVYCVYSVCGFRTLLALTLLSRSPQRRQEQQQQQSCSHASVAQLNGN